MKIKINDKSFFIDENFTILQAAQKFDIQIPVFCYHSGLKIAGNCRMCLVEDKKSSKLVASCAMPCTDGMEILTKSEQVIEARKSVLEFLLMNHPLDCPVCVQGGECDLQDISMIYGRGISNFDVQKRAVKDKYLGPLVESYMNRCIHCTRCIRFMDDIAGTQELIAVQRGEDMEITTTSPNGLSSELSGNIIDLCPVGAFVSKPYSFKTRPWDLNRTPSIDVFDAVGSNIYIDTKDNEVLRVQPRENIDINLEWIGDKSRYSYDGLAIQRITCPYIKSENGFQAVTWSKAIREVSELLTSFNHDQIGIMVGDQINAETILGLSYIANRLDTPYRECRTDKMNFFPSVRASYLFNTSIKGIQESDYCLFIGTNLRYEAPIINLRFRQRYLQGGFRASRIGYSIGKDFTFPVEEYGDNISALADIINGKGTIVQDLKKAKNPMIVLGYQALCRQDTPQILNQIFHICKKYGVVNQRWNGFNILHRKASRVAAFDLNFVPKDFSINAGDVELKATKGEIKLLYLCGVEDIDFSKLKNTIIIYQGHHGDKGAQNADIILPGSTFVEQCGTYTNLEGRVQNNFSAIQSPDKAKEDYEIIALLGKMLKGSSANMSYEKLQSELSSFHDSYNYIGKLFKSDWEEFGEKGDIDTTPFLDQPLDYYMTDPISRHSKNMVSCIARRDKI